MTSEQSKVISISTAKQYLVNAVSRSIQTMFPGYAIGGDTKHTNFYRDYGYPDTIDFRQLHQMWRRNGIAKAGVTRPVETCWQELPFLQEKEDTHDRTPLELVIDAEFDRLNFWTNLAKADEYSRVGSYAGVIFRFRDGLKFDQPVSRIQNGLAGVAEIIPAWQGQLTPAEYYTDELDERYGHVKMYQFTESAIDLSTSVSHQRQMLVHPDRVHIWSRDSAIYGESVLEAGFNDLITMQKIIGAGGEGFWKNAKSAPILNVDPLQNISMLSKMLGTTEEGLGDKIDEIVGDYQTGLDKSLLLQGMKIETLQVNLPDPEKFFLVALQSFAASLSIPLKILVGSQSGERASTEDAKEWNKTCMSRRLTYVKPNVMAIIQRFIQYGILPAREWYLLWADLTESSTAEKCDIGNKMADINKKMEIHGEQVFTGQEIRETLGWQGSTVATVPKRDKTQDKPNPKEEA